MPTATGGNDRLRFYYPWPSYGEKMSRQWPKVRENFQNLAPFVRAAYVDLNQSSEHDPGENDLSGLTFGEQDFFNRHRVWYDKQNNRWAVQYNSGTEAAPVWDDYLTIRDVDGRVTVHGYGGLDSSNGGFYAPVPRNLAVSSTFNPAATEWVFQHNLDTKPVLWNAFNMEDKSVTPQTVDVSDPNIAYFYFAVAQAGRAIVVAEQARGEGIRITDGTNVFAGATRLAFNDNDFYLSNEGHGMPVVNLKPIDLSEAQHSSLGGLTADDHPQYARTDGTRTITGDQAFASGITVSDNVRAGSFYSPAFGEVAYANQGYLTVTDTGDTVTFSTVNKITFEQSSFYLTADANGKPIVSFRGTAGSSSGSIFGSGAKSQDFSSSVEWQFTHNFGLDTLIWATYDDQGHAIIPDKVSVHNNNITYFYFSENVAGRAVVIAGPTVNTISVKETDSTPSTFTANSVTFNSNDFYIEADSSGQPIVNFRGSSGGGSGSGVTDHGALTGLSDDDHTQYILVNGTRKFTGTLQGSLQVAQQVHAAEGFYGGSLTIRTNAYIGNMGTEDGGINLGGTTHNASFKVSDIGASDRAMIHIHRHSAGLAFPPTLLASKSRSNTSSHTAVQDGEDLFVIQSAGWTSGQYDLATEILSEVDGTPGGGAGDLPGRIVFKTTPSGSGTPVEALRIDSSQVATFANPAIGATPTSSTHLATKGYVDGVVGPGFYGVNFRETDGNPPGFRNDTIYFNSNDFYLTPNSVGKPVLNFRGTSGGGGVTDHGALTGLSDDDHTQYSLADGTRAFTGTVSGITPTSSAHLATKGYVDNTVGPGFYGVNFRETDGSPNFRNDTIYFDSDSFYLHPNSAGKPVLSFRGSSSGGISGVNFSDGTHSYSNKTTLNVNSNHFYLSQTASGDPMLNLRYDDDILQLYSEAPAIGNFFIDTDAPYNYDIQDASILLQSGSCTIGFYIISSGLNNNGTVVTGLDPIIASSTKVVYPATAQRSLTKGDQLKVSIYNNSSSRQLRISVRARKPN